MNMSRTANTKKPNSNLIKTLMIISRTGADTKPQQKICKMMLIGRTGSNVIQQDFKPQSNELDIDDNLLSIYKTILLKGDNGEVSLGSILTKNTNIQYFIDIESYLECELKDLSKNI